jgi:urease subunit beta/urease subunit gamma/beta
MIPGEWLHTDEPIEINAGRRTHRLSVRNTGDRPIQVGSHFHFYEVNRALEFDRDPRSGMRLDVPSGSRFASKQATSATSTSSSSAAARRVIGFNNLVNGGLPR